jgi:hypothetical protein
MLGFSKIKGWPSEVRPIRFYVGIFQINRNSDRRELILFHFGIILKRKVERSEANPFIYTGNVYTIGKQV